MGQFHRDTSESDIASSYSKLGNHTKSLEMFEEVYEIQKRTLGELGNCSRALKMYLDVYNKQKVVLGKFCSDTPTTMSKNPFC